MEEMREIVDIRLVHSTILVGGPLWLVVCILAAVVIGSIRRAGTAPLIRGVAIGLLGPVVSGLWLFYRHMVRYDPETGYFGLDKLWVLAVNAVVFVLVGALFGYVFRRIWALTGAPPTEAGPVESANQSSQSKPASQ